VLVVDSHEDVSTRPATLTMLVGSNRKVMSQLVASRWNQIDHARVIAPSQRMVALVG